MEVTAVPHTSLYERFRETTERYPDKTALIEGPLELSYSAVAQRVRRLAGQLQGFGVTTGDRVVLCAGNLPETVVGFWAALAVGGVAVVISPEQPLAGIRHVLDDSGAAAFVATTEIIDKLLAQAALDQVRGVVRVEEPVSGPTTAPGPVRIISEDLAALIYTSGSTGAAKGVMLSHANMLCALNSLNEYLGTNAEDVLLCALPLAFDYGLYQMLMAFSVGATLVLERDLSLPLQALKDIEQYGCTVVPGVPVFFELLEQFGQLGSFDLTTVRTVTNTGAALLPRHIAVIQRLMPKAAIYSMYGVTESKRCTYLPPELIEAKPGSVGLAIPNTELSVLDEQGQPCKPNEVGQIVIRGGTVMRGYWGKPEATAEKIREHPQRGGRCLFTGDYGYLDEDGYLYFKGRMDEVVKVRGRKLVPREVEDALRALDGVVDASVICTARADDDPEVAAFVQVRDRSVDEATLRAGCLRAMENYQVPTRFQLVNRLPRNENGKVDKFELSRRYPVVGT